MPNMSYCRFRNTLADLRDCREALDNRPALSEEEGQAARELIQLCMLIVRDYLPDDGAVIEPIRGAHVWPQVPMQERRVMRPEWKT